MPPHTQVRTLEIITVQTSRHPAAKKQRVADATKVLLDIAKESADAFPPLKSCLGGISALINHYDVRFYRITRLPPLTDTLQQTKDVEDKLESLIPWVAKLKDTVTRGNTDSTQEEAERREQLTRFVSYLCLVAQN